MQDEIGSSSWNYCPGKENPAELLTRGERSLKLRESKFWLHGPDWLSGERRDWPVECPEFEIKESSEERRGGRKSEILQASCIEYKPEDLIEVNRINNFSRLLRITAWVKRFIFNSRNEVNKKCGPLTAREISVAENYWIKRSQEKEFLEEI
ncbi:hypothetical protein AVEN_211653-1 [Araneus ventricosus]|uniref:Uncharacterized protein n=1 Tax=Araneus ventricosus TaxID=182803 RepID=A0A4Y2X9Y6_ARAVE|nr:hypothetical protein AVEN_211653-1 [Araneus ventricosus]